MAVSLAKVADVDVALGNESAASEGFQDALKKLQNLLPPKTADAASLEKKVCFFLLLFFPNITYLLVVVYSVYLHLYLLPIHVGLIIMSTVNRGPSCDYFSDSY